MKLNPFVLLSISFFTSIFHFNASAAPSVHQKELLLKQTDSVLLDSLIKMKLFKYTNNKFVGAGWDYIKEELKKSQMVMIGEQHGMEEVPLFTGLVSDEFKPKALVVEIDPYTASDLKKIAPYPKQYSAYFKKYPYDLAFFSYQTELDLAKKMVGDGIDIWGVNEVNFLSIGHFFRKLAAEAKSPKNIKLASDKAELYEKLDKPIFKDINKYNNFSAYKISVATVDSLIIAFKNENALSRKMLRDLKVSVPIIANIDYTGRLNFMKKNLLNYLDGSFGKDVITMPRLIFKLGANHLVRTDDRTGQFEIGNFADNLAGAAGKKTLHILIFGKAGTVNQMAPVDNSTAIVSYNAAEGTFKNFKPFFKNLKADEWVSIDLRPIRKSIVAGKLPTINETLKEFILGNDIMVIFGDAHGNKFIE
jgi:hypothetical protein